jgi:hypothetical protein
VAPQELFAASFFLPEIPSSEDGEQLGADHRLFSSTSILTRFPQLLGEIFSTVKCLKIKFLFKEVER